MFQDLQDPKRLIGFSKFSNTHYAADGERLIAQCTRHKYHNSTQEDIIDIPCMDLDCSGSTLSVIFNPPPPSPSHRVHDGSLRRQKWQLEVVTPI
jgi:hypothetical protein